MADFINTIDVLGDDAVIDSIIDRSITEFKDDTLETVGTYAFNGCAALTEVDLPNVTSVAGNAFQKCTALTDVNCPALTTGGAYLFDGCTSLKNVNLPALTSVAGRNMFYGCSTLETISLPNLVTADRYMFYNCGALKNASVPKLTSVPQACFQSCGLLSIDLPLVTSIASAGLYQNINLVAVILRSETMCTLAATNVFDNCCHIVGTTLYGANPDKLKDGFIYVPRALVDSYKTATNWSKYASQFRALEDYTVDGTITGALDETKI